MISWELQDGPVVEDLDKKVVRRKIWKLNKNRTKVRFEKRIKELVSTDAPDYIKDLCCRTIVCNNGGRYYRKCKNGCG